MVRWWKSVGKKSPAPRIPDHAADDAPLEDPETAELERLYRQALDAFDAADAGLKIAAASLEEAAIERPESPDADFEPQPSRNSPPVPPASTSFPRAATEAASQRILPRQIIEAALFVGVAPLTAKKLASLLGGGFEIEFIEQTIDELNLQYGSEDRPYEIRLGEGGYRMALRSSFDAVRCRVFGIGPREIKLSQEALEVLALVAYQQPITREQIEEVRQAPAAGVLRQLLRRELIAIERSSASPQEIAYRTTDRFLDAFGLGRLDDLPHADELNLK